MIDLNQFGFERAASAYLVANTPLYIARSLRTDPVVVRIAGMFPRDAILESIKEALSVAPATSRERIIPFILLGALAVRQDREALLELRSVEAPHHRWFGLVLKSLLATVTPVQRATIQAVRPSTQLISSTSSNSIQKLEMMA